MQHLASKIQVLDYHVLAIAGRYSSMPDEQICENSKNFNRFCFHVTKTIEKIRVCLEHVWNYVNQGLF